ncbi:DUF4113 domain-containing protein [Pseudomonas asplenii]|nr:DUF4113 domain-containing protein [Pseudomonas fuscovaginae]
MTVLDRINPSWSGRTLRAASVLTHPGWGMRR